MNETRISRTTSLTCKINLKNYSSESIPTESFAGETLLYISNRLSCKPRGDLNIFQKNQIESTFIEKINTKKANNNSTNFPKILFSNDTTSTEPILIANITSIADKTKKSVNYSHKHTNKHAHNYSHKHVPNFLRNRSDDFLFISPIDKYEIINIIYSLNSNKSTEPGNLPTKILKLLKNDIFVQLSSVFDVSISTNVFPCMLKIAKVVPIN